jgi:hypothetical protein
VRTGWSSCVWCPRSVQTSPTVTRKPRTEPRYVTAISLTQGYLAHSGLSHSLRAISLTHGYLAHAGLSRSLGAISLTHGYLTHSWHSYSSSSAIILKVLRKQISNCVFCFRYYNRGALECDRLCDFHTSYSTNITSSKQCTMWTLWTRRAATSEPVMPWSHHRT